MKKCLIFISLLFISFSGFACENCPLEAYKTKEMLLCVEVGNARTKACILPNYDLTLEDLRKVKTMAFPSGPWLKQNIDQLFNKSSKTPLYDLLSTNPSRISLSIFGPIYNKRIHGCGVRNGVFENLHEIIQKQVPCKIQIESDAVSWAIGALEYLQLQSQTVHFPCVAITFGTYIGIALVENPHEISAIEIWAMSPDYTRLKPFAQSYNLQEFPVAILLKKHIETVSGGEAYIDEKMKTYRPEFNLHVRAFIDDISEHMQKIFPSIPEIKSVFIGGGYSRFIDPLNCSAYTSFILSPQALTAQGIAPDIIQLLGCQRMCYKDNISTQTYPDLHEIQATFDK
jgi:hypothetical protein